ncbi:hypothetical protein K440DRAFT_97855 [Wilcoxina mikolae CBS 423.85]|nr:hypothetical protein K440DRAFT_97855 [Wilcoxina mikolae CBS 423.85]
MSIEDGPLASGAIVPYHHFLIAAVLLVLCVLHVLWGPYLSLYWFNLAFLQLSLSVRYVTGRDPTQRRYHFYALCTWDSSRAIWQQQQQHHLEVQNLLFIRQTP